MLIKTRFKFISDSALLYAPNQGLQDLKYEHEFRAGDAVGRDQSEKPWAVFIMPMKFVAGGRTMCIVARDIGKLVVEQADARGLKIGTVASALN